MNPVARIKLLAAAAAIIALAGLPASALAGDKGGGGGGGLGGAVGGAVGGVTGAVGNAVGGVTGAVGNAVGGVSNAVGGVVGGATNAVGGALGGATSGVGGALGGTGSQPRGIAGTQNSFSSQSQALAIAKLKSELLKVKAGVYVLDRKGHLVSIDVRALNRALKANARVYAFDKGALVRVSAKVVLAGLKVNTKVYVLDQSGNLLTASARATVGGLKARIGANAGTKGVNAKLGLTLGGSNNGQPGNPGNPGDPNNPGRPGSQASIASKIGEMSPGERRELKKKCGAVLASPSSYDRDAVLVCRVLAQLTGL